MHLIFLRHGSRIDKSEEWKSPHQQEKWESESSSWLATFDPPLDGVAASKQMDTAYKKLSSHISFASASAAKPKVIIHCSPYNRCIQTAELLVDHISGSVPKSSDIGRTIKLRVDQGLSEWLSENFNLNYLPPNDDGYSLISNLNTYLNNEEDQVSSGKLTLQTREKLRATKDQTWMYNKFGRCGEFGESPTEFKRRCFDYLTNLLRYYYQSSSAEDDKNTTIFIVAHGAVISTLLQMLLNRPIFNEIPLCTPIYLKQSDSKRTVFNLMDYDFNLSSILLPSDDRELFKLLKTGIDVSLLDFDNIYNEFQITGSSTADFSKSTSPRPIGRPRRNTVNIGSERSEAKDNSSLRQTRSSRQLHLMDQRTNEEKIIDLAKLESYFGGSSSESDDESTSDIESPVSHGVSNGMSATLERPGNQKKASFTLGDRKSRELNSLPAADEQSSDSSEDYLLLSFPNNAAGTSENDSGSVLYGFPESTGRDASLGPPSLLSDASEEELVRADSKASEGCQDNEEKRPESRNSGFLGSLDNLRSKSITLLTTTVSKGAKKSGIVYKQLSQGKDNKRLKDEEHEGKMENGSKTSAATIDSRSSEESRENLFSPFVLGNKRRRKRDFVIGGGLDDKAYEHGPRPSERSRDVLKNILFNNSNSSFQKSDEDVSWFGGNFQKQKV